MIKLDASQFKSLLDSASRINIILPKNPSFDEVASGLSLKLVLEKGNLPVTVICPDPMTVEFHRLVGADKVSSITPGKNLIITFPGQTENVDKVSYNIENGLLQLVVTPKDSATIDPKKLEFISGGSNSDLNILFGVAVTSEGKTFSIAGEGCSQAVTLMLGELHLPINSDAASNLLQGIEIATDNFTGSTVSADTFEAAASLLRSGARRANNVAKAADFPPGVVPADIPPANPDPDWFEPKIYRGTNVS